MKFGNWLLTENSLDLKSDDHQILSIELHSLLETTRMEDSDDPLYRRIVDATADASIPEDDLYDLNYAFVFAAAKQDNFSYEIFDRTLDYQFQMVDYQEEDEDE